MDIKDWIQQQVEFLSDESYWDCINDLSYSMTPSKKINEEIEMYYQVKNEIALSPEAKEYIKLCVDVFRLQAELDR